MNVPLLENPWLVVEKLGWTLLQSTWQLAIVAIQISCVLAVLRSSHARYRTAFVGLMLMAISPVAFLAWSISNLGSSADSYSSSFADPTLVNNVRTAEVPTSQRPPGNWEGKRIVARDFEIRSVSTGTVSPAITPNSDVVWLVPCTIERDLCS